MEGNGTVWTLATAVPNAELIVAARLLRHGFENFVPKLRAQRVYRGRHVETLRAAFPRYLFVAVAPGRWPALLAIEGVTGYVRDADHGPVRVASNIVDGLIARADAAGVLPEEPKRCPFARGERVLVHRLDTATGHFARFDTALPNGRAVVELDWMGRWCPTEVALDELSKVERKAKRHRRRRRRSTPRPRNAAGELVI
jgi:transcription antitermination factor NusG